MPLASSVSDVFQSLVPGRGNCRSIKGLCVSTPMSTTVTPATGAAVSKFQVVSLRIPANAFGVVARSSTASALIRTA